MTYDTFKQAVLDRLSCDIPDPKQISIQTFYKNNGVSLDGLVILENGCNISPALYLNHYYDGYTHGVSFQETYEYLLEHYEVNKTDVRIDVRFFTDFENVKPRLTMKLIHYEKNRQILNEIPHIRFLDLAIVFYCFIPIDSETGNATILVRNSHMDFWKTDLDTLYRTVMENTPKLLPPGIRDLNTMLKTHIPAESYSALVHPDDPLYPMFILSNEEGMFGAASILYENLLSTYAERFQSDFYILPSSIHEVILIPAFDRDQLETLSGMVRDVNRTHVADEEILSDHAYYYSRTDDCISM